MILDTSNQFLLENVLQSVVMNSITSFNWFFYLECVYGLYFFILFIVQILQIMFFQVTYFADKMAKSTTSSIVDNQLMSTIQVFILFNLIIFIFIDSINCCYSECHTSQFSYSRLSNTIDD